MDIDRDGNLKKLNLWISNHNRCSVENTVYMKTI